MKRRQKITKFDIKDLFSLERISFEVELTFGKFIETSKLIRNIQDITMN